MKRRIRIIIKAICLAIIGAILPMIGVLHLAWTRAFNTERQVLYEYSSRMLERARHTLNEIRQVIILLDAHKINSNCSPEHIKWLHELSLSMIDVKTIGYFENGKLGCSSWGKSERQLPRTKTNFILPDGLEISVRTKPYPDFPTVLVSARKGTNYDIFIDTRRFSDIIVTSQTWLAVVFKGELVTERHSFDPDLTKQILGMLNPDDLFKYTEILGGQMKLKPSSNFVQNQAFIAHHMMVSVCQLGPFYFIAAQPELFVYERYKQFQLILLPLGLLTAAFIVGLVIYYSHKRLSFKAELIEALRNQEFIVHYQPIISTEMAKCIGAEALVRWQRPNGCIVPPNQFIEHAEQSGIISGITDMIIDRVFSDMENYFSLNRDFHVSINISANDIQTGRILGVLEAKIAKSKILRKQIWIELTEHTFLEAEKAKKTIQQARQLGYVIAIDDFGTGYSSLSCLQDFPLDILKIDKSFIDSLGMQSATSQVTDYIIDMAKSMNLKLIAEGVEKQSQCDYLKKRNVEYIQGYFYSKPLAFKELMQFIRKGL